MSDEQAHLIQLRLAGLTDREMAEALGKGYGTLWVALQRVTKRLRGLAFTGDVAMLGPAIHVALACRRACPH